MASTSNSDGTNDPKTQSAVEKAMEMVDIDKILDSIPSERKGLRYTEGWDPNNLDEELKKHPFFMKDVPAEGEEVSPLIDALQQLKYSPDENTPEELAINYKEDGIFHFKLKKYRIAVLCFTEGIKCLRGDEAKGEHSDLEAQLYNNRAASQFFLQNYRSCLMDCIKAGQLKPNYFKPTFRALECCMKLEKWEDALEFCRKCEKIERTNEAVAKFRVQATKKLKMSQASGRKGNIKKQAQAEMNAKIMSLVEARKIKCRNDSFLEDDSADHKVKIGEDGRLEWPVIFFYPEFGQSDFIEAFHEDMSFVDHLTEILEIERPPWDTQNEYHIGTVGIYFVDTSSGGYVKVDLNQPLNKVLSDSRFELPSNGIVGLFILAPQNEMCRGFLERLQSAADDS